MPSGNVTVPSPVSRSNTSTSPSIKSATAWALSRWVRSSVSQAETSHRELYSKIPSLTWTTLLADLNSLLRDSADGKPVQDELSRALAELAEQLQGPATGWSSLGIVAGATYPEQAERLRILLPSALFPAPGTALRCGAELRPACTPTVFGRSLAEESGAAMGGARLLYRGVFLRAASRGGCGMRSSCTWSE